MEFIPIQLWIDQERSKMSIPATRRVEELLAGPVFMTGSQLYGTPRLRQRQIGNLGAEFAGASDVDLVVGMPIEVADQLAKAEPDAVLSKLKPWRNATVFRFGVLNLLAVHDAKALEAWQKATAICYSARPVTREVALNIHQRERQNAGVEFEDYQEWL